MKSSYYSVIIKYGIILSLWMTTNLANSQELIDDSCPSPTGGRRAHFRVELFLTFPDRTDERIETGATNETVSMIRPVFVDSICLKLNAIVRGNTGYKQIDDNLHESKTKYYYRTDNLYYIFWNKKPQYDGLLLTGPRRLFIVVSKDYQHIWEYYL